MAVAAAVTLSIGDVEVAQAAYIDAVSETFASGATFVGDVTFDDSFNPIAVNGVLTGYSTSQTGPVYLPGGSVLDSSASETINWVDWSGNNYATAPVSQNRLDDADPATLVSNSILFTIDFTNPLAPVFVSPTDLTYNGVNTYSNVADALVSGTITPVASPAPLSLLAGGFAAMGWFATRRRTAAAYKDKA